MAVELADFVPSLIREVNPPGTTVFANVDAAEWAGYLADAFWEARMDGFLAGYTADSDGTVTPADGVAELPRQFVALIILYAGVKILRTKILNTNTQFRAKAGPVEFEQQNSATMLAEMLKQLAASKNQLVAQIQEQTPVFGWDETVKRITDRWYHSPIELMGG